MRRAADRARTALALLFSALAVPLAAQDAEVPRAPRIIGAPTPAATPPTAGPPPGISIVMRPPTAARLAPLPEDRNDGPEEIVVIGRGWRLPDLGSEWRARQQEQARSDRLNATILPLYNPDKPMPQDTTFLSPEQRRHGNIELFRLRFGRPRGD
jgi:hypothetical protein